MPNSTLPNPPSSTAVELTNVFRRFVALRPRFKLVMPESLALMKAQLASTYPDSRPVNPADHDLLFNIGVLLTRQQEPMTMSELSRAMNVPLSTATRIVDWLVHSEYAERVPDADDRRVVRVKLTPEGTELYRTGLSFVQKRVEKIMRRFTPEERQDLVRLLNKLVETLEEEIKE